jgi:hypothetical protein
MSVEYTVLVWFPASDLPDVLKLLRAHNRQRGTTS